MFSPKITAFSKILERSFFGPHEPVNMCNFQSSSFNGFLGAKFTIISLHPNAGNKAAPGAAAPLWAHTPAKSVLRRPAAWRKAARGAAAAALRAQSPGKSVVRRPAAGRKAARGAPAPLPPQRPAESVVHRPGAGWKAAREVAAALCAFDVSETVSPRRGNPCLKHGAPE